MAKRHIKTNAVRILENAGVDFEVILYDAKDFESGTRTAEKLGEDLSEVYKTLVTENSAHEHFVFVINVADELDLKKCAASVGQKSLEMIHVKDINKVTGYIRGGCSPIGMKKAFRTVIDKSAENKKSIIISGGKLGVQIKLNPHELARLLDTNFADIARTTG